MKYVYSTTILIVLLFDTVYMRCSRTGRSIVVYMLYVCDYHRVNRRSHQAPNVL
jgi:hypothetical protein